jgi:hypothetical protein
VPTPKNGGSHAELEGVICIFTVSPSDDAHIYSRCNLNRDDGGHDTPRYAGRRGRVVLQKEGKHELCVPDPSAMSGVRQRTRRHLRPQAPLEGPIDARRSFYLEGASSPGHRIKSHDAALLFATASAKRDPKE